MWRTIKEFMLQTFIDIASTISQLLGKLVNIDTKMKPKLRNMSNTLIDDITIKYLRRSFISKTTTRLCFEAMVNVNNNQCLDLT
jgi:hypothetical protein